MGCVGEVRPYQHTPFNIFEGMYSQNQDICKCCNGISAELPEPLQTLYNSQHGFTHEYHSQG